MVSFASTARASASGPRATGRSGRAGGGGARGGGGERPRAAAAAWLRRGFTALGHTLLGLGPAVGLVGLLACVLVPLPPALVDVLLTANLALALALLVAALSIPRAAEFLVFPRLLLAATLLRLVMNLATTRLILTEGAAGAVIDAFAGLVVRGDVLVGLVMFLVITVVQFVVVARGTERVAEVAARFALDGLPGQQAAIDADLRAGAIDGAQAQVRRARLVERSQLLGAMDGAAKFVRGDAIAGLVITAVNGLGGLAVGITRDGLDFAGSVDVYARLAVGDGLMAQLPAMLVAVAAALVVTRVDREPVASPGLGLADAEPPPWFHAGTALVPAVALFALALVPGLPLAAFATTGAGLLVLALVLADAPPAGDRDVPEGSSITLALADAELAARLDAAALARLEVDVARGLGLEGIGLRVIHDPQLASGAIAAIVRGRVVARGSVAPASDEAPAAAGETGGARALRRLAVAAGPAVIDADAARVALTQLGRARPSVLALLQRRGVDAAALARWQRAFLAEGLATPAVHVLAEAALAVEPWPEEEASRLAAVRAEAAATWLWGQLDRLEGAPRWLQLDPDAEQLVRDVARAAADPRASPGMQRVVNAVGDALAAAPVEDAERAGTLLLAGADVRAGLARALAAAGLTLPVVSVDELRAAGHPRPAVTTVCV